MARAGLRDIVFGLAASTMLLGCVETGQQGAGADAGGTVAAPGKKKSGQDVEAPDVFQTTDSALWDGRPSLGGIWVAAPDVTNPERVLMFNPATGKSITGALFKRERDNPGPRLQLSSDAAEALGILAGQPTEIRVTALRKEKEPEPEAAAAEPGAETAAPDAANATPEGEAAPAKDGDAAAIASAALDAVDAGKSDPAAAKAGDPAAAGAVAAGAAVADGTAAAVDATPKKKTWKERRAEAKAAREAKKRAAAEAKAAAAAGSAAPDGTAPVDGTAAAPTADSVAVAPIEAAPLDARSPEAAAPVAKTKTKAKAKAAEPVAEAAAPAEAAPVAGGPARPIQVASFSKEDNAKRAAEALAKIGITATPQKSEKGGKAVWGVIVTGDDAMLKKIKDAGFADAYYLK